jgi:hypothetical protein
MSGRFGVERARQPPAYKMMALHIIHSGKKIHQFKKRSFYAHFRQMGRLFLSREETV